MPKAVFPELGRLNVAYQRGLFSWEETREQLVSATGRFGFTESDWDSIEEGIIVGEKPDADDVVALCKARAIDSVCSQIRVSCMLSSLNP